MGMVPPFLNNPHDPGLNTPDSPANGLYWPVALAILALIVWFSFQLSQILGVRHNLMETYKGQEALIQKASRMRSTIDALADGTSRLAAGGNGNAKRFIEAMAKRGISFNPPKDLVMKPSGDEGLKSSGEVMRPTGDPSLRSSEQILRPSDFKKNADGSQKTPAP